MPRRGVEASIRSIAYTNAIATRPALPPLPARVLANALLLVLFLFSRSTGSLRGLCMHPPPLRVFMLQRGRGEELSVVCGENVGEIREAGRIGCGIGSRGTLNGVFGFHHGSE